MTDVTHPQPIRIALVLCGALAAIDIAGPLLPSSEGEVAFGIVAAVLVVVAAIGLSRMRRWGYVGAIVVAALHILTDAPAIAVAESPLLKVMAGVAVAVCLALIVLVTRPEARHAYST